MAGQGPDMESLKGRAQSLGGGAQRNRTSTLTSTVPLGAGRTGSHDSVSPGPTCQTACGLGPGL